jgi:hypothetical protein
MTKDNVLEPTTSAAYYGYTPESLAKTHPIFRGTWVFRDPDSAVSTPRATPRHVGRPAPLNQKSAGNANAAPTTACLYVIQVDWIENEEAQYEKGVPRFYKLKPGKEGPTVNMDINMLELGEYVYFNCPVRKTN